MRKPDFGALGGALGAALAALGTSGAAAAAEGGMPQLNVHDFSPQIVWLVVSFAVLYVVMARLAIPAVSQTLAKREARIQADLDAAEKASEETRALVTAYEKKLAEAREEARRLQRERAEADGARAAARLAELGERLNARIDEAEKRIAGQRAIVMDGIEQMASDIAASVYAKVAGGTADAGALGAKVTAAAKGSR